MSIIQIIKEQMNMTERERDICRYILENPEKIEGSIPCSRGVDGVMPRCLQRGI